MFETAKKLTSETIFQCYQFYSTPVPSSY